MPGSIQGVRKVSTSLGPSVRTLWRMMPPAVAMTRVETWTVARGDHLWSIAAETTRERTGGADEAAVARYWRRLIAANHETIGNDADLIHPGLVLVLPELVLVDDYYQH